MQLGRRASRIVSGFLCAASLAIASIASAQVTPNVVECSMTPQGVMSCATFNGWACTGTAYQKTCGPAGHTNMVTCTESTLGIISCHGSPMSCYSENGAAKCYWDTNGQITASTPSFPATNINSTSSSNVKFTTINPGPTYTINGFTITGDFQITGTSGSCTSGSSGSICTVTVAATPRMQGVRNGSLSMSTTIGTVRVALTVTGSGLPVPAVDDKNAGFAKSLRSVSTHPRPLRQIFDGRPPRGPGSAPSGFGRSNAVAPASGQVMRALEDDTGNNDNTDPCSQTPPPPPQCQGEECECTGDECECTGDECDQPSPPETTPPETTPPEVTPEPCEGDECNVGGGGAGGFGEGKEVDQVRDSTPGGREDLLALADDAGTDVNPSLGMFVIDPTHAGSGNKVHVQTDFSSRYPNPLSFSRTYNSFGFGSAGLIGQNIGVGWRTNWDRSVVMSSTGTSATVVRDDGKAYVFTYDSASGAWRSTSDVAAILTQSKDASGYAIGWTLALPSGDVEQYDALGRLSSIVPLAGPAANYALTYDASGRLQTVSNGLGRQISFTYDSNNRVATLVDSAGNSTAYGYDSSGRLSSVTYADARTRQYAYENAAWPFVMTAVIDGSGTRYVTFAYDTSGRVSSSQYAGTVGGGTISYSAGSTDFTDAVSARWHKTFATNENEVQVTSDSTACQGCPGGSAQLAYDATGTLTSFTDRNGTQTTYSYSNDHRNLPTRMVEAVGLAEQRTTTVSWHATLPVQTQINKPDKVLTYQYDGQGRKTQKTVTANSASRTTVYSYNAQGLLSQVDGSRTDVNDVKSYTYDSLGNVSTITNSRGQVTTYSQYNGLGKPQRIDYPNGTARTYTYDAVGRVLTSAYLGNTTTYTYDPNGKRASVSTSDGHITTYLYDSAHRLTGINNNFGEQVRYTLDATNKKRSQRTRTDTFDSTGLLVATTSAAYDALGRVTQRIDAQGHVTTFVYDNNGNVTRVTDPLNNVVQMNYDGLNRPILITDPLLHTTQLTYDTAGRVTRVVDPIGNATQYAYTGFGDTTQLTSPDTGVSTYTYDSTGNRLTKVDARGKTTTYSYDALNRLVQTTFADGQGVTKTYDVAPNGVGQLSSMTDPAGTTSYTYNANGLLLTKTQVSQGVTLQLTYGRDSLGRVTSITYPSGKVLALMYTNDRITAMTWNGATLMSGIQYFPFGGPESWLFGGATEYTRYIDQNNRIFKYLTPAGSRTLSYDLDGRITQITDAPSALMQNFTYDSKGQLLTFSGFTSVASSETRSYTYDANGNRLSGNVNGLASTYIYVAGTNKLQSVSGLYTNTYDVAGNLVSDGRLTHTYDARGRLVQTVVPGTGGTTLTFQYNGRGERMTRWDSAANTGRMWIYDERGHVLGEYAYAGGAPIQELVWLGSTPVAVTGAMPTTYGVGYIWTDQLSTPRAITNTSGQSVWQWDSAPFGDTLPNANPSGLGPLIFNHRFPGQYFDVATGLHQNVHRDYDPQLGRYVQSDPVGLASGPNTFGYATANPLRASDPKGLDSSGTCQATQPPEPCPAENYQACVAQQQDNCDYGGFAACMAVCVVGSKNGPVCALVCGGGAYAGCRSDFVSTSIQNYCKARCPK